MKVSMQEVNSSIPRSSVPAESRCSYGMFRYWDETFQGHHIHQEISSHHNAEPREVFREKSGLDPLVGIPEGEPICATEHSKAIGLRRSKRLASKAIAALTSPNEELVRQNYFPQRQSDRQRLLASSEHQVGGMYPDHYIKKQAVPILGNKFVCPVCNLQLTSQANLQQHEEMHTSRQSSPYNIPYRNLTGNNELLIHNVSRTDERSFSCTQCDKKFSEKNDVKRHQRIHAGKRPFKCEMCGTSFSRSKNLKRHRRNHNVERPYKCDLCAYASATKGGLKSHQLRHTGERPYKCKFCDYASAYFHALNKHVRRRHESSSEDTSTD